MKKETIEKVKNRDNKKINIRKEISERNKIKEQLKTINTETAIGNSNNPKELKEIFNKIEDNYNIKITKYNKEMYKQGFIDGVNLMINCLNSKEK